MDGPAAGERARDTHDVCGAEDRQAVHRDRGRGRQQIQQSLFGLAGGLLIALAGLADEPIPFSHKQHAPLKIQCKVCHSTVETGERASFPAAAKCMTCHRAVKKDSPAIRRLAALAADEKPAPSERIYKVADFVSFSHARHRKAAVECRSCHGRVEENDAITLEFPPTMKFCVDCHKTRHAALECNTCHELGQ